jgi:hypothetical protein
MKSKQLVKEYLEELEHFFIPGIGGWPLILEGKRHAKLMKLMPCFYVNEKNRLALKKGAKPNPEILAELYKCRYEELNEKYTELRNKVRALIVSV